MDDNKKKNEHIPKDFPANFVEEFTVEHIPLVPIDLNNSVTFENVLNAPSSNILLNNVLNKTLLSQKFLAENIFELNTKTFVSYCKVAKKLPSRLIELATEILTLYKLGIELFGNAKTFNKWLKSSSFGLNKLVPITFLNTSSGIALVFNELKRLEFGATA